MSSESPAPPPKAPPVHLGVLSLVAKSHNEYGVMRSDYKSYRKYCARKVARLRKTGDVVQKKAQAKGTSKARAVFEKKELTEDKCVTAEALSIALFEAERHWAFAMDVKADLESKGSTSRGQYLKRLRKAADWSAQLLALSSSVGTPRTALEAASYSHSLQGLVSLETSSWSLALRSYTVSQSICVSLASHPATTPADAALLLKHAESLQTSIRYCNYSLTGRKAADKTVLLPSMQQLVDELAGLEPDLKARLDDVLKDGAEQSAGDQAAGRALTFRGLQLPVSVAVAEALSRADDLERAYVEATKSKSRSEADVEDMYSSLLAAFDDCLAKASPKSGKGSVGSSLPHETNLKACLLHRKLLAMSRRCEHLALDAAAACGSGQQAPAHVAHLYGCLLSNARAVLDIQVAADTFRDDDAFATRAATEEARCRALRSYWLALARDAAKEHEEAAVLFGHAAALARDAAERYHVLKEGPDGDREEDGRRVTELADLERKMAGGRCRAMAAAVLARCGDAAAAPASDRRQAASLAKRIKAFEGGEDKTGKVRVAELPPTFEPVLAKPVFFDIAGNLEELEFPILEEKVKPAASGGGGLLGWFRR